MPALIDTIEGKKIAGHRPCPRLVVNEDGWGFAASQLSAGYWTLLGLWGDAGAVHMAVLDASMREIAVVTLRCPDARFPSVGALHPPAIRLERALRDLYGLEPVGLPDTRPWLDLGFWNVQHPLGQRRDAPPRPAPYAFLPTAVEAALEIEIPPRAVYVRALTAELERLANHFGDIGAICNDASFALMHAQCGILREKTLRTAESCFGHRLMMDVVVPGGVARDLAPSCAVEVAALVKEVRRLFPRLIELYDNTASLQERTATTGVLHGDLARQFGAGGYVGRASGRAFDARKTPGYPPYDRLRFEIPVLQAGDVNARVWVRIREVEQSLALIDQILQHLPAGPIRTTVDPAGEVREGLGLAEAFRGEVLVWARFENGR